MPPGVWQFIMRREGLPARSTETREEQRRGA